MSTGFAQCVQNLIQSARAGVIDDNQGTEMTHAQCTDRPNVCIGWEKTTCGQGPEGKMPMTHWAILPHTRIWQIVPREPNHNSCV